MITRYAITDPRYYGSTPAEFTDTLKNILSKQKIDMICFRDKQSKSYFLMAKTFLSLRNVFCNTKFLLHGDYNLACQMKADGVHLTSSMIDKIKDAKALGLWVIVSTHTLEEALKCEKYGADAITYSPVFETPGKGEPKGLEKLKEITGKIAIKVFALGGIISSAQIRLVEKAGADGFASIRYFVKVNNNV